MKALVRRFIPAGLRERLRRLPRSPMVRGLRMRLDAGASSLRQVRFDRLHDEVVVVGNGPSLTADLPSLALEAACRDFVCVNTFCNSEYFALLKPRIYVFLDAYFYASDAHPSRVAQREQAFASLDAKTDWPLQVFLPWGADETVLRRSIRNPKIRFTRLAVQPIDPPALDDRLRKCFDSGRAGPLTVNVLIYAIYLAIWAGYRRIHLHGADMSFHKDVEVDPQTNDLLIRYRYFDQPDRTEPFLKNPGRVRKWRMSEFMQETAKTFRAHEVLDWYARLRRVEIINRSPGSLIDAYRRCPAALVTTPSVMPACRHTTQARTA
jgi:hypothetical protein